MAPGWLKISVPGWVNSVIVNGSEGSVQTGDLSVDTGKDVWVVVNSAEDASVFYEGAGRGQLWRKAWRVRQRSR